MKITKIDKLGRIVIPIEYRKALALNNGSKIEILQEDKKIIITPHLEKCILCGNELGEEKHINLCSCCIKMIKSF